MPMSRAARGSARPGAMPFRAVPRRSCASWRAAIRVWSACPCSKRAPCSSPPASLLAEWLYEAGIGETRAALVEGGCLLEMAIERDDETGPRVGATLSARLTRKADASGRGMVMFDDGSTAQLIPVPAGVAEGARVMVEVVRESLREGADTKPLRVRAAAAGAVAGDGPGLLRRIDANGLPIRRLGAGDNLLDEHGWS